MGSRSSQDPLPTIESLTRRERDIILLLADFRLSGREIAERLYLAPASVKWYTRQIYAKLGVNERREAVLRARTLGLLGPDPALPLPGNNLPAALTPFIGRKNDVAQVARMLADPNTRLVTLTGAGGLGKTRLAVKVAETLLEAYPQGVWLVELASVNDGALVEERTALVFGQFGNKNRTTLSILQDFLRTKKVLLVLDNCEHLVEDCARLANALLGSCSNVKILATSRETLGITGENAYTVPPLTLPDPVHLPEIDSFLQLESVQLFVARARAVQPAFAVTEMNIAAVAQICHKLDGIPLAMELAAARLNALDIVQIARRLDENLGLLTGGSRTALPRHKTMQACIDWSYHLLTPAEQAMLRSLSVFVGGWTLPAAEAIHANGSAAIDLLGQLIDKSLVITSSVDGRLLRYRMLEPIHQYAHEKLVEACEDTEILRRHLAYFLELAEAAEPGLRGQKQNEFLDQFELEVENLRLALDKGLQCDVESSLRLAAALMWFWHIRGRWSEGLDWLLRGLISLPDHARNSLLRAKALAAAGTLHSNSLLLQQNVQEFEKTSAFLRESLDLYRKQAPAHRAGMAFTLLQLARCATQYLDVAQVISWANQSLALYRVEDDPFGISECLLILADNEQNTARVEEAFEETLRIKRNLGDWDGIAYVYARLGSLAVYKGDFNQAVSYLNDSLNGYRKTGNERYTNKGLHQLGWLTWVRGDCLHAMHLIQEALTRSQERNDLAVAVDHLLLLAEVHLSQGNDAEAVRHAEYGMHQANESRNKTTIASGLAVLGRCAWLEGQNDLAVKNLERALSISQEIGSQKLLAETCYWFGKVVASMGDADRAKALLQHSLAVFYGLHFWHYRIYLAYPLEAIAQAAVAQNDMETAACLFGAAERWFPLFKNTLSPTEGERFAQAVDATRTILGEERFQKGWQAGRGMTARQIVEYVTSCST